MINHHPHRYHPWSAYLDPHQLSGALVLRLVPTAAAPLQRLLSVIIVKYPIADIFVARNVACVMIHDLLLLLDQNRQLT
jgi:hypothetical protein